MFAALTRTHLRATASPTLCFPCPATPPCCQQMRVRCDAWRGWPLVSRCPSPHPEPHLAPSAAVAKFLEEVMKEDGLDFSAFTGSTK